MAKLNNLNSNKVQERKRQVRTYGTKTDLASTTTERGNTHWTDGSNVNIDGFLGIAGTASVSGTLRVTGLLDVTGTFNASGSINLSGSTSVTGPLVITGTTTIGGNTNITGELNVTGPTALDGILDIGGDTTITGLLDVTGDTTLAGLVDITGNTKITGDLDVDGPTTITGTLGIEGITTLKNDLNVTEGGTIKAGNLEIEPANGGQINFLNGSLSSSGTFGAYLNNTIGVRLEAPTVELNATNTNASGNLKIGGLAEVIGQILLRGIPTAGSSSFTPNMYVDSNGRVYRTPWTPA